MKYHIITYGCQMNEADSDLMASLFAARGWERAPVREDADLIVINTCSVRQRPEHKVFSTLGELRPWKNSRANTILVVAGCMAQRAGEEILKRAPHVDIVIGTRAFHRIEEFIERVKSGESHISARELDGDPSRARCGAGLDIISAPLRAFVPIIRGCTNFCSYCIVPHVRGPEVSRPADDILREVESLVGHGTREITLLGQNVLAYGRDREEDATFHTLLARLNDVEGLWRIRFMTSHPRDVTDDLIEAMANLTKVCEHIHLPIQAGTDKLLREMGRGYTVADYLRTLEKFRSSVPGLAVTTDIMVGFPGETEEEFEESLDLYRRVRFDAAFTFAYSPRPGTAAADRIDQVPSPVRIERLCRLIEMQNRITIERNEERIGEEAEVLIDGPAQRGEGLLAGRARDNRQVILAGDPALAAAVRVVRLREACLWGLKAVPNP